MANISFLDTYECRSCQVQIDDNCILTLEVEKVDASKKTSDVYHYTVKNSQLLKTLVRGSGLLGVSSSGRASFVVGNHPFGENISELGLVGTPTILQYTPEWSIELHPPSRVCKL